MLLLIHEYDVTMLHVYVCGPLAVLLAQLCCSGVV